MVARAIGIAVWPRQGELIPGGVNLRDRYSTCVTNTAADQWGQRRTAQWCT